MTTGLGGTFVISWAQTEVDGIAAAPVSSLHVGTTWSWRGDPVRVDGPATVLRLGQAKGAADLRERAARKLRRLLGPAIPPPRDPATATGTAPLPDNSFIVTDGAQSFVMTLIDMGTGAAPLLLFGDQLPPRDTDLWVVACRMDRPGPAQSGVTDRGVPCFTPGTRIATPDGPRLVQDLRAGDLVQTRDSGPQEVLWIGSRHMTGARLFAMPHLRPIRFRAGALGVERPDHELLVSPDHRMLIRGHAAQALFNTDEVLVAARDLVNGHSIAVDTALREVSYLHLLLPRHQVIWANGLETESFHPAQADLHSLPEADRRGLLALFPALTDDPHLYGASARRALSMPEAAILRHEAA
jgi:hypothetical protein